MRAEGVLTRLPIRAKLTLACTAVIALTLSGIGLFLYRHFESGLDAGLNTALRARADDVAAVVRQEGVSGLSRHRTPLAGVRSTDWRCVETLRGRVVDVER